MKSNRSLKQIAICKARFQDEKPFVPQINLVNWNSPSNVNLDSILGKFKVEQSHRQLKHNKTCQSQKFLDIPKIKIEITSPKIKIHEPMTERSKHYCDKNIENLQITPFDLQKPAKNVLDTKVGVLTPANRNIIQFEQPKRPKILTKQRQNLNFSDEYKIGKVLGKGRFGNVYRAQHIATNFTVAVKQISLQKVCKKLIERLTWEIKIQSFVKHQNCLELYKCYKEGNSLFLIVQLGDCSLFDRLREKRYFTEVETCYYVTQTIKALMHMHQQGIIHRDLKPENIVLINNVVKLADFGWSIYIGKNSKRTTFCGTLDYVSPEIVLGKQYDEMVDVWSVGVLCYQLCTGHAPFESSKSREETYRKILNVELKFPKYLSQDVKDFISRLLTRKPQNRMSLDEAINHKWVKKYFMK